MFNNINKPMSGKEIQNFLPDATILLYRELKNLKKLPKLPIILLYEVKKQVGHWVTILKTPEGIEHFDSYGYAPDNEFDFVPEQFKYESNQNYKYLLKLLYDSGEQINYNPYNLQGEPPISTCGRWSILRNLFNDLTIDQFYNTVIKTSNELNITPDELVSITIK